MTRWLNKPIICGRLQIRIMDLISSVAAMAGYGAWAVFANYSESPIAAWRAGCVQGAYAFCSTLFLTIGVRKIYLYAGKTPRAKLIAFSAGIIIITTIPTFLNIIAQTPNVLKTTLPGILIGSVYVAVFSHLLE